MNSDIKSWLKTSTVHQLSYLTVGRTDYLTAHFKIRKQVQLEGYDTLQLKKKEGTHPPYFTSSGFYKYRNYSFNAHILHRMLDWPTTCSLFIRWKDFYWDSCWDNIPPLLVHQPWCCWPFGSGDIAVNRGPHLSSWRVSEDTWGCLSTSSWRKLVLRWLLASLHSLPNSSFSCHSNCVTLLHVKHL